MVVILLECMIKINNFFINPNNKVMMYSSKMFHLIF